jgi:hypothetical protein
LVQAELLAEGNMSMVWAVIGSGVSVRKANEIITQVLHSDFSDVARFKWGS